MSSVITSISRPPKKPATSPDDRAAQERDREQREQQDVRGPAGDVDGCDERHLQERGDEDEDGDDDVVVHGYGISGGGRLETSTITESSDEKSTSDLTSTCWYRSVLTPPTDVTRPIGIPFG